MYTIPNMTIARGQMKRQLYQDGTMPEGGLPSLEDIMEGKISPAEMALIKETLEDVEFMQEGYNLDRPGQAMGGIMTMIPRDERFVGGITRAIKKAVGKVGDVAGDVLNKENLDKVAQVASFIPGNPLQPFAQAYTAGRGAGIGGSDFGGFQIGGFTPSGGMFGTTPTSGPSLSGFSFAPMPGQLPTGQSGGILDGIDPRILEAGMRIGTNILQNKAREKQEEKNIENATNFLKANTNPDKIERAVKLYGGAAVSAALAKLAFESQQKQLEDFKRDREAFERRREVKRKEYDAARRPAVTGAPTGPADVVRRPGQAVGGIMRGMKKLLDKAYEMVSSRGDFDFSDYKMRGQLMAEELAEIKFKKNYYDLDQKTQMDLYEQSSDYLNDVAADMADDMRDMMKERFGKAEGGIMDVPLRTTPQGVTEMDFRKTGGFVPPVGIKEKADDIPAMLSNNEFVFTADAVRAAGGGSVNKGAERMYSLMKKLEGQA